MRRKPKTETLFLAIAGEAEACLRDTRWEEHVRNILNLAALVRERMRRHWEAWHQGELDRLAQKARGGDPE